MTDGTIRVLVLEDNLDFQCLLKIALVNHEAGYEIDFAETLGEACAKLGKHSYDVILTDLSVPDSDGMDTVARIRQMGSRAPVIVLTVNSDPLVEKEILTSGAQDFLVKRDFSNREIHRTIQHALQRQEWNNEADKLVSELTARDMLLEEQADMLRKKNEKLSKLYKTAQEFVDNVSHDFRTPLTVIMDYVNIIREGMVGEVNEEQKTMLDKVAIRADDLNHMVDDLLDVSKLDSGLLGAWRRRVRVEEVIQRVEPVLQERAGIKQVDFSIECDADLPEVYCDAEKAARVITNLAVNAIKFVGKTGRVRLWAQADPVNQQVVIGVDDNGPGIDKQSLEHMFQRFQQLDCHRQPGVKGFGLGLNIAQQFCRINLGELSVSSRVGEGSTFSFTLPEASPREVVLRWLRLRGPRQEFLTLMKISAMASATESEVREYEGVLNALLRRNDLLLEAAAGQWLLAIEAPPSEQHCWKQRAAAEFDRLNRNRPSGQLPPPHTEKLGEWASAAPEEEVLAALEVCCGRARQSACHA